MRKKSKKPFEIQNTKQIMYAGYAIILCLLLVVTVIFVNSLFKNNQQLNLLSSYFFQQTYIEDMHNAAISRTVSALRMAMEKDAFKQLELQEEMFDSASEFIAARDKFRAKIKKSPQVKATFEKILDDVQLTSGLLKQVVEFSINGQQARAQQIMQEQSVENQRRILKGLQKLKQQEFDKVKSILSNSIGENRKTRNFLIVISVLTIFAILSVAYVMIRFVSKTESTLRNQGLRVRLLYEATSGLNTNWDEQIEQIIRLGCTLLNFKKAFICRYANEKKQCGVEYTTIGVQNQVLEKSEWLNSEFCVEMMAESTNQDSCSVLTSSSYDNQSNSLAIPITVNGRPYGSLNFIREDGYQKTLAELDVDFSNMIANWVGVAIERQQAHQAMEDAIAKANAASKAKSQFVANMSHEIRTPLTAILGFSESLLENDVPKDEYHNAAETIVRSGKHLQQIINDILDLSKIEAGQLVIETIKTDVRDVLDDVGSLMSKRAQSKNISFRIIKHYPLPGIITTDPTRLKQILLNIAGNAIKFTRHGQVTIELTFLFEQKQLRFEVKDTGIGMTPYELSKLFKPFTQADSTITRRFGGTGLGLVIAKQLVEKLGGEISVTSKKEVGTNFVFTIATGEFNEEGLISEDWSEPTNVIEIQKVPERLYGHVLFAEDGIENQQLIAMYVRKKGVTISIVDNGKAAVEAALKKEYDLILMDIQMPIMGGLEATEMLRTTGYDKPIVALTANAMKEDRDRCLAAGMDDYLSKPVELERFYRVLAKFLPKEKHKQEEAAMTNGMEQDPEFLALVQGFLKRLPEIVAEIRGGTDEQNWSQVQTASHKLKGMGGGFGFPELTSAARKINDDVRENRFADIEVAVGELELLVRSIMQSRAS